MTNARATTPHFQNGENCEIISGMNLRSPPKLRQKGRHNDANNAQQRTQQVTLQRSRSPGSTE